MSAAGLRDDPLVVAEADPEPGRDLLDNAHLPGQLATEVFEDVVPGLQGKGVESVGKGPSSL